MVVRGHSDSVSWRLATPTRGASRTQRLILPIKAEVSPDLPRFTAIARLTARVNVERQHSLPNLYFISVLKDVRITFSFWLDEKILMNQKYKIVI